MLSADVELNVDITSQDVLEAHRERLETAAQHGYAFSKEVVPHDTGLLKQSGFSPEWREDGLVYGYQADHAAPMEYGTDPGHTPPPGPILRWAQRIGKSEGFGWFVATEVIPEQGVQAQPYLRPSAERMERWLETHPLELE